MRLITLNNDLALVQALNVGSWYLFCRENQGLVVYDDLISAGLIPTLGIISQVLGCLRKSSESSQHILYEERSSNSFRSSEIPTTISVEDACGIYLPRALTIYEVFIILKLEIAKTRIWFYVDFISLTHRLMC